MQRLNNGNYFSFPNGDNYQVDRRREFGGALKYLGVVGGR